MGVIVTVLLMDAATLHDEAFIRWVSDTELRLPKSVPPSRWPTLREFKSVLEGLENYHVSYVPTGPGPTVIEIRYKQSNLPETNMVGGQEMYIWDYLGNED